MKGDYYRYISENASGSDKDEATGKSYQAYKRATEKSEEGLKTTHPIRLGLALNFSVFEYEIMMNRPKACQMAKEAFDNAIANIEEIDEGQYKDATTIMTLLRDNLTLWTAEI